MFTKELTGISPVMLSLYGECSDEFIKLLIEKIKSKVDIKNLVDHENNNLLHLATKLGRFELVKSYQDKAPSYSWFRQNCYSRVHFTKNFIN
jgi:hypothetical protein